MPANPDILLLGLGTAGARAAYYIYQRGGLPGLLVQGWQYIPFGNSFAWYHFSPEGWMDTGWYHDTDNNDYFLHPVADGTRGYMYTGTHNLNGQTFKFEETAGQLQGHLLR